jgi:hypothetical protein
LSYTCLIIWNISLADLLIFGRTWSFPIAQTATFTISAARRHLPFTTVTFFLNTLHAHSCFLLGREKNGHGIMLLLSVSAVMHNSATVWPVHEIIDCTTCNTRDFYTYPHSDSISILLSFTILRFTNWSLLSKCHQHF